MNLCLVADRDWARNGDLRRIRPIRYLILLDPI